MRKGRYSEDEIAAALERAEAGVPIAEIARAMHVAEATFAVWQKRLERSRPTYWRERSELLAEIARLRKLVAELRLLRVARGVILAGAWREGAAVRRRPLHDRRSVRTPSAGAPGAAPVDGQSSAVADGCDAVPGPMR